MRRVACLSLAAVLATSGQAPAQSQDLVLARFQEYLESLRVQARIPGLSAAITGPTEVLWERAFGRQDLEREIAARTDTPYHVDGLTQIFTAALVLRCVEEGRLSLDDRVGRFVPESPLGGLTLRQVLSHTSGSPGDQVFSYRLERLQPLGEVVRACTDLSFQSAVSRLLDRFAMFDSVPGPDAVDLEPGPADAAARAAAERYQGVLDRLARPYVVDSRGRALPSEYRPRTLSPAGGLITTVRDLARWDLAMKADALLLPQTLAIGWRPPAGPDGTPLPHALGWFAHQHNRWTVVWQFGVSEDGSSSLIISAPAQWITLILLANSDGLVRPFAMDEGTLMASPFGRLFVSAFVR